MTPKSNNSATFSLVANKNHKCCGKLTSNISHGISCCHVYYNYIRGGSSILKVYWLMLSNILSTAIAEMVLGCCIAQTIY